MFIYLKQIIKKLTASILCLLLSEFAMVLLQEGRGPNDGIGLALFIISLLMLGNCMYKTKKKKAMAKAEAEAEAERVKVEELNKAQAQAEEEKAAIIAKQKKLDEDFYDMLSDLIDKTI